MIIKTLPVSLLQSLIEASRKIGIKKTQNILEKASQSESVVISDYVISECCKLFQIKKADFFNNNKKGNRKAANAAAAYVLYNCLNFTYDEIIFCIKKKKKEQISVYRKYIKELNPAFKFDREVLEKIRILQKNTEEYKNKTLLDD